MRGKLYKNTSRIARYFIGQILRKPGSVLADHLSSHDVAIAIKRIYADGLWRETTITRLIHHLAADRVYLSMASPP
jgi:hypothetical protein